LRHCVSRTKHRTWLSFHIKFQPFYFLDSVSAQPTAEEPRLKRHFYSLFIPILSMILDAEIRIDPEAGTLTPLTPLVDRIDR
jgi:hypothetical protein